MCEKAKIEKEQVVYDTIHPENKTFSEIDDMGKKGITGKYTVAKEDYDALTSLAKEGISSRGKIRELKDENKRLWTKVFSLEKQIERLMARNGLTREDAESRLDVQMSADAKLARADFGLINNGGLEHLRKQCFELVAKLKSNLP